MVKIIKAGAPDFNRKTLERGGFDILFAPEEISIQHSAKRPGIALDYVSMKFAKKHNISIAFNFNALKELSKENKAKICSRMRNIIKLARKEKVNLAIEKENNTREIKSLLQVLGASTNQIAQSISF